MNRVLIPNPRVYLDVAVGNRAVGRMTFEVFADSLPHTAENFRALCTGETGLGYWLRPRWFKNTHFHRIIKGLGAQGGDFNFDNGRMNEAIYGQHFRDESFLFSHSKRGLLSMANSGKVHTNGGQFFVTFNPSKHLDQKHVVFGQLETGWDALTAIESASTLGGKPRFEVLIYACGELSPSETEAHVKSLTKKELEKPQKLAIPDPYDPVPSEVYRRARAFWDNTL